MDRERTPTEELEALLPSLEGKVLQDDYGTIYNFSRDLNTPPMDRVFYRDTVVKYLTGVVGSAELYKTDSESRGLMNQAIEIIRKF